MSEFGAQMMVLTNVISSNPISKLSVTEKNQTYNPVYNVESVTPHLKVTNQKSID